MAVLADLRLQDPTAEVQLIGAVRIWSELNKAERSSTGTDSSAGQNSQKGDVANGAEWSLGDLN